MQSSFVAIHIETSDILIYIIKIWVHHVVIKESPPCEFVWTAECNSFWRGCGTSAGWKFERNAQTQTIWLIRRAIDIGMDSFSILNVFILAIARSTCIRRDAIFQPASTSSNGSCCLHSMDVGIFSPTPNYPSISLTVNHGQPWLRYQACLLTL